MTPSEQLVANYLDRLFACGRSLTRSQVEDLMSDVREHVAAATRAAGNSDEATVRTVLDRLGAPEDIVAAAAGEPVGLAQATASTVDGSRTWGWREVAAIVLIVPGAFLVPVLAPVAGLIVVRSSAVWDRAAKRAWYWIGTFAAAMPLLLIALGMSLFLPFRTETHAFVTQSPAIVEGQLVPSGVSGSAIVPYVTGLARREAVRAMWGAGLFVQIRFQSSATVPKGNTIRVEPVAGSSVGLGSTVTLVISTG